MFNIEYGIRLNEEGRPYIHLPEDYEQRPEDRFFAIEIARYMLRDLLIRRTEDLDESTVTMMDEAERLFGQLGDEIANILYGQMKSMGDVSLMIDNKYHIRVDSIKERDDLPEKDILYNGKIFDRTEGLRVCTDPIYKSRHKADTFEQIFEIYELVGGITNENWVKL